MDRRSFLKGLFAVSTFTALNPELAIEQFLTETSKLNDADFIDYVTFNMNLYCDNPGQCVLITNITE